MNTGSRKAFGPPLLSGLISLLMLGLIYAKAVELGLRDFTAPMASKIHEVVLRNVAIALSGDFYGRKHDYTGLTDVYSSFHSPQFGASPSFQTAQTVDSAISHFARKPPVDANRVFFGWGEDVGLSDFASVAFRAFGYSLSSLFKLYFLVLLLTAALFIAQFRDWQAALFVPPVFLVALYATLPAYVLSPESSSVFSNRSIPALGLLPTLHALLWLVGPRHARHHSIAYLLVQLMVVIAVVHARTAASWQIVSLIAVALSLFALGFRRLVKDESTGRRTIAWRPLAPAAFLIAAMVMHSTYMRLSVSSQYKEGGEASHSKWHMLFMGLTLHPRSRELGWQPDDVGVTNLAHEYFEKHKNHYVRRGWHDWNVNVSPWSTGKWGNYETVVRDMFIDFAVAHPGFVIRAQLQKAMFMVSWVLMGFGATPPTWLAKTANADISTSILQLDTVRLSLFAPATLFILIATAVLFSFKHFRATYCDGLFRVVVASSLLFLGSLLPGLITAPIPHGMIDVIVAAHLFVFIGAVVLMEKLVRLGAARYTEPAAR